MADTDLGHCTTASTSYLHQQEAKASRVEKRGLMTCSLRELVSKKKIKSSRKDHLISQLQLSPSMTVLQI